MILLPTETLCTEQNHVDCLNRKNFSCTPDKDIRILPGLTILISPMFFHPGPDKNHVNLMHWLYRKSSSTDVDFYSR